MFDVDWGLDGSAIPSLVAGRSLAQLIEAYQTDPVSTFHKLRYHVRCNQICSLARLKAEYGHWQLSELRQRHFKLWHLGWSDGGKLSRAQASIALLRTICGFGASDLEDQDCERICLILRRLRFPHAPPRKTYITAAQADAVRRVAHQMGWPSIALAQAIQFEAGLRQKDVIGEWVPDTEPGESEVHYRGMKWLRGLRWNEIDDDLILDHLTSKKQKDIEVDLKLAPMVLEELPRVVHRTVDGPVIINEVSGLPWTGNEFRRKWRICASIAGVPKDVWNMDSRSGAFSEADQAGADEGHIQTLATHSDVGQTRKYIRGNQRRKITDVQQRRVAFRRQQALKEGRDVA